VVDLGLGLYALTRFSVSAFTWSPGWLNQAADNVTAVSCCRLYVIRMLAGLAAGQFLLNLSDPAGWAAPVSILISLAAIRIYAQRVTDAGVCERASSEHRSLTAWRQPGGWLVSDQHLLRHGARHMGAVYASRLGMQVSGVSLFMACWCSAVCCCNWPLGNSRTASIST
jgi:hypothetical protein